jgi:hypothetical protein
MPQKLIPAILIGCKGLNKYLVKNFINSQQVIAGMIGIKSKEGCIESFKKKTLQTENCLQGFKGD